jgi:hypothetical protein
VRSLTRNILIDRHQDVLVCLRYGLGRPTATSLLGADPLLEGKYHSLREDWKTIRLAVERDTVLPADYCAFSDGLKNVTRRGAPNVVIV